MKKELFFDNEKTGTYITIDECLNKCESLATGKIIRKYINQYDKEDLEQMARIGIMKAFDKYDSSYKSPFIQYAEFFIKSEINAQIRKDNRIKRGKNFEICSINSLIQNEHEEYTEWIQNIKDNSIDIENKVINNLETERLYNAIKLLKKDYQKIIFKTYWLNKSCSELAKENNVTRQAIQNKLVIARRKLKEILTNDNTIKKRTPRKVKKGTYKYIGIDITGKEFYFNNIKLFAKDNKLSESCIRKVIEGKTKTHKGWTFKKNKI